MSTIITINVPTTGAVQIPVGPRGFLTLINNQATNGVFIGSSSSTTTTNGVALLNSGITVIEGLSGPLWAIATTGATNVGVITS